MLEQRFPASAPRNPFHRPSLEKPEEVYDRTVNKLARQFIYDEGELDWMEIERAIKAAREQSGIRHIDEERHDLETLQDLLKGIAAHEKTNEHFLGTWQAALNRQAATHPEQPKAPETLTRDEVAVEFESFTFKKAMLFNEQEALKHYERLLERPNARIELSRNISLDRSDIEVLVVDLKMRIAERTIDDGKRRIELRALDEELAGIIAHIPDDQSGKRFELEEIYLLRRLIHNADTGHLASVSHGTPRQDLRADRGSVDIVMAAAGDVLEFQLKTFKSGTHREAKELQREVLERARQKLQGSETHLVVLNAESVEETYEASRRQAQGSRHTLADKFAALEPLASGLREAERVRLLSLIGLTETQLAHEQEEFDRRQAVRTAHEAELRQKREQEERRFAEGVERIAAQKRAELEAENQRLARIEADKEKKQHESLERMRAEREAAEQKQRTLEERLKVVQAEAKAREQEAARRAAHAETKASKEAEKKWAQTKLEALGKPDALVERGLLAPEDRNKPAAILAAKKKLAEEYPNIKAVLKEFPIQK